MWETDVLVEREEFVGVAPEKVWELAGSMTALSLVPGRFAFGLPDDVPETDRLCCLLLMDRQGTASVVADVREETPGQLISWQLRNRDPAGRQVNTLSVHPKPGGSAVRITVVSPGIIRDYKVNQETYLRRYVKAWLKSLRAVVEERAPWPQPVMPAAMRQAAANTAPLRRPLQASAAVVIAGSPSAVWESVFHPASFRSSIAMDVVGAGLVPGASKREVGQSRYTAYRLPGGRFAAIVSTVTELAEGHHAVTRDFKFRAERTHLVTPAPGGIRLELIMRWPLSPGVDRSSLAVEAEVEKMRSILCKHAEDHRAHVEQPPANSGS